MRPNLVIFVVGLFAATAAPACPACGDKLSLVGGGVSFERVSSGPPGRIVLLAAPGSTLRTADSDLGLVAEFKRAGHEVTVIDDSTELDRVIREQGADVVLTHWSQAQATAAHLGTGDSSPAVVSVAYKADDAAAAKADGAAKCLSQAEQRKGRKLAETVDKVLEQRRKGLSVDCAITVASRTS